MSKAERLNQHDLTLNDYSFRIAAMDSRVDALKDDRDSLERRVFALEKAIQNQDDTIQNEDATFRVGDRVEVVARRIDMKGVGTVVRTDSEDEHSFLVKFDDGDWVWFSADELRSVSPSTPFPAAGNTPVAETFKVGDRVEVSGTVDHGLMGTVQSVEPHGAYDLYVQLDVTHAPTSFRADELRHADSDEPKLGLGRTYADGYANGFQSGSELYADGTPVKVTEYSMAVDWDEERGLFVHTNSFGTRFAVQELTAYDNLRTTDSTPVQEALDVDVTAAAGVIHTNSHGDRFHVIPEGDFLEAEHWRQAFNAEERENINLRQEAKEALEENGELASELAEERHLHNQTAERFGIEKACADEVQAFAKKMAAEADEQQARADRNSLIARGLARKLHEVREDRDAWKNTTELWEDGTAQELLRDDERGTKGDGVVVASLMKERDEARETAHDLAVELKDTQIELAGSLWRRTNLARRHEYLKKDRDDWQLRALKAESDVTNAELELERARSSQRIDPARAGLSRIETGDFDWVGSDDE